MLDCLWLEKVLHTHAKNNINTSKRPQSQIPAKEARASFPFLLIRAISKQKKSNANSRQKKSSANSRRESKDSYQGEQARIEQPRWLKS